MKKEDFTKQVTKGGYIIFYKNKPIGGAGTKSNGSNIRRSKSVIKQINDYSQMADREISSILEGNGNSYYLNVIEEIDQNK